MPPLSFKFFSGHALLFFYIHMDTLEAVTTTLNYLVPYLSGRILAGTSFLGEISRCVYAVVTNIVI
jgi:hypothetical protein